jgi:hypothetical protein
MPIVVEEEFQSVNQIVANIHDGHAPPPITKEPVHNGYQLGLTHTHAHDPCDVIAQILGDIIIIITSVRTRPGVIVHRINTAMKLPQALRINKMLSYHPDLIGMILKELSINNMEAEEEEETFRRWITRVAGALGQLAGGQSNNLQILRVAKMMLLRRIALVAILSTAAFV